MIPGGPRLKRRDFRTGLVCGVVGCVRRARHQWAYPCAVNTMSETPSEPSWLPVCDECDMMLNRRLLEVVGVPPHILEEMLGAYAQIQGDGAYA